MSTAGIADRIDPINGGAFVSSFDVPGRNIVISAGQALIKGQLWRADAPVSTPIPAASAQNRIDRLVLRLNRGATTSPTVVQPVVITGTPSGTPVEPPLVQTTGGLWDLPVCSWTSASTGALSALTDERILWALTPESPAGYYKIQQGPNAGLFINAANGYLVAAQPGNPNTPETYHLAPLGGGWTHVANEGVMYTLLPDDTVYVHGQSIVPSGVTGPANTLFALPAGYRPLNRAEPVLVAETLPSSPYTATSHQLTVRTGSGNCDIFGAAAAGNILSVCFRFPLHAPL